MASSLVGIDIGNSSVKMALHEGGLRLVASRLPENMVNDGDVVAPSTMSQFLKDIRDTEHIRERDCCVVLNESQAFFRHVSLPPMNESELKINLPYEFRDFIDGDPSEYVYDYVVDEAPLNDEGKPERLELYAAAAQRSVVEETSQMLRKAGFRLKVVIPSPIAYAHLLRDYIQLNPIDQDRSVVFVNIGYSNVTVTLFNGWRYQAAKVIEFGCNALDEAIADLKAVDRYTASTYKEANFEGVLDTPDAHAFYDRLCVEVNKVVNFYNFSNPDKDIQGMYLLGGGAQIPQLVSALSDAVSVPPDDLSQLLPADAQGKENDPVCTLAIAALLEGEAI